MARKLTFIINPIAGPGDNQKYWHALEKQLQKNGIHFRAKFTKRKDHAGELTLKQINKEPNAFIVSIGGDGTFNEVASVMVNKTATLAHIPRGSGNGLARMLKISGKNKTITSYLSSRNSGFIDAGKVNERYFFCTAGFGFDALIAHHFSTSKSRGLKSYVFYTLKTFLNYKGVAAEFELDGEKFTGQFFSVTVANANQFGNNAFIAPKANLNDGLLDVTIIRRFPLVYTPFVVLGLFGKFIHKFPFVETKKIKSMRINTLSEPFFHRDGDNDNIILPATINAVPQALKIQLPPK